MQPKTPWYMHLAWLLLGGPRPAPHLQKAQLVGGALAAQQRQRGAGRRQGGRVGARHQHAHAVLQRCQLPLLHLAWALVRLHAIYGRCSLAGLLTVEVLRC